MKHLPFPPGAGDDVITHQCNKQGWSGFRSRWLAAASAYRNGQGNPWVVKPANFTETEGTELRKLYDSRRKNGPIARIRRPPGGFSSCPMCGSSGGRSLDHALPKAEYPEFSILRENLVPACTICNSDEKGVGHSGAVPSERLIHPYYDDWASQPLWQVAFGDDLTAVTLLPVPLPTIPHATRTTVEFHLSQVLGDEWRESARRYWGILPAHIRRRVSGAIDDEAARAELSVRLREEVEESDENGWRPAFLRGVLNDDRIPSFLASQANKLPAS